MQNPAQKDQILENFFDHLFSTGLSKNSHKNYKSDVNHFFAWFTKRTKTWGVILESLREAIPFLSSEVATEYKKHLKSSGSPKKTINRRLSSLRHLGRYFLDTQILDFDFMEGVTNTSLTKQVRTRHILASKFEEHLISEKVKKNTLKNYISDVKQFLDWLEQNGSESINKNG